ncbi:MAG: hypothetical protein ACYT04_45445 [Nostoc sp.]
MTVTIENSIRALLENSEEVTFGELSLTKHALEMLFKSDEAQIPKEELFNDMLKIVEVSERITQAETLRQKSDIYYSEYRPLSDELKAKYSDFLPSDSFKEIEAHEKCMDGLRGLIIALGIILIAFEEEIDRERLCGSLYTGMVRLSDIIEEYLYYLPQGLIKYVKNIALAFLNDSSLKPDKAHQNESVFSYLIGLKNTARAVLWQIEEHPIENTENEESHLIGSLSTNLTFTHEIQIQKNQAAIDWARSRLEQIENIRKAKG